MALNPDQRDVIKTNLKRIDLMIRSFERGVGLPSQGLNPQELQQAHVWATQQAEQAVQLAQAGRLPQRQPGRGLPIGQPGSRLFGQPNLALGESAISNLPADPRDQAVRQGLLRETLRQRLLRQSPGGPL